VCVYFELSLFSPRMVLKLEHDLMELHSQSSHQLHLVFQQMLHSWQPWQVTMLQSLRKRVHSLLEAVMEDIPFGRWSDRVVGRQQASSNKEQGGRR